MTTAEGQYRTGASSGRRRGPPGSRTSRLAEASQQLEIVLEEIDLDEQPAFGEAVVEAIEAVEEASTHARGGRDDGSDRSSNAAPVG